MSSRLVGLSVMVLAGCSGAHQVQDPGAPPALSNNSTDPPDAGPPADAATVAVCDEVACLLEPELSCCVGPMTGAGTP